MKRIDLHLHTTASDGVYSPAEVVQLARQNHLHVMALTDHDTLSGIAEAQAEAAGTPLQVISGIELNCRDNGRDYDLLGYLIDPTYPPLQHQLHEIRQHREGRARRIVENLRALGIAISYERVVEIAAAKYPAGTSLNITRPHIARAMVEVNAVATLEEAFENYLSIHHPSYVERYRLSPQQAIRMIQEAGGIAVLAHPGRYTAPLETVKRFNAYGIDGIEVYYPNHSSDLRYHLLQYAKSAQLLVTGGSDFHARSGDGSVAIGSQPVPPNTVDLLLERQLLKQIRQRDKA